MVLYCKYSSHSGSDRKSGSDQNSGSVISMTVCDVSGSGPRSVSALISLGGEVGGGSFEAQV